MAENMKFNPPNILTEMYTNLRKSCFFFSSKLLGTYIIQMAMAKESSIQKLYIVPGSIFEFRHEFMIRKPFAIDILNIRTAYSQFFSEKYRFNCYFMSDCCHGYLENGLVIVFRHRIMKTNFRTKNRHFWIKWIIAKKSNVPNAFDFSNDVQNCSQFW